MLNRLKLELRQKQLYEGGDKAKPIVVQCNTDGTASYIPGSVPAPDWRDFTDSVDNLEDLKLSWQAQTDNGEASNEYGSNYSKGVTLDLKFIGEAFEYIYAWLMETPCQSLNSIEVRITDMDCLKSYRPFEIKLENTKYAPNNEPCIVSLKLREKDDVIHSFQKTIIEDDWQGWFNKEGNSTKEHPSFLYVVEKKPKFFLTILVVVAYIAGMLSVGILIATTDGKRWIRKLLGICYFCPSPYIRTYIENICQKYGYSYDTIFDDIPTNMYRDACLFFPVEKNVQEFDDYTADDTRFIWDNRTAMPVNKFLDRLKKLFNAEWYVTPNNTLVFKPREYFDNLVPIYNFVTAPFELINLVYTFSGKKKAAYGSYNYTLDAGDQCTNEIKSRYNAIVDYDGKADNPMLEGNVTKYFEFSGTAFNKDGTTEPYFEASIKLGRIIASVALLVGLGELFTASNFLTVAIVVGLLGIGYAVTNNFINDFFKDELLEGVIRTSNNQINQPRIVIHDRSTPINQAKVVYVQDPTINPFYNTSGKDYYAEHPTYDDVGFFGGDVKKIYNYPMYIDEEFKGNLYDQFHEYDNPLHNTEINQNWEGQVQMCCEMLDLFGAWDNDYARIGAVLVLERRGAREIKGRIEAIDIDYKQGFINLKGRVLK